MMIGGRVMMTSSIEEEMVAGPSSSLRGPSITPKFNATYFDEKLRYAPPPLKGNLKRKIELCKPLLLVIDSPMSPPPKERGPSQKTPLMQPTESGFRASYDIQNTKT